MDGAPGFRPLYRQVYDHLVKQISTGVWKAAEALPSEHALASSLGVSQGTVRKALDAMASENLIERRQGKGTYVSQYNEQSALFRFFRMAHPGGEKVIPDCGEKSISRRPANATEARKLAIKPDDMVVELRRTRWVEGRPAIFEMIVLPLALFPDIDRYDPLPNALYTLYQAEFDINIVQAEEELHADIARKEDASRLDLPLGSPILQIDRIAIDIAGRPVELRTSRCDTARLVYAVSIR
ncbi:MULTISPECIES: GntR family transcriptional regulator [Iodidimonas]|jgi:GntR family transcriptional regulator|uniref:GntR family transcriptional regulator n=1 Tax=Iodidimonas nitroreducens TaxID=1236968 RepID=A0A5A7N955_9PROT|nr:MULTISPECIES: GntR family transcriptional regulator [Iodidimonas]GAK33186.1 putative HTH-type transcriptional regulator YurK [alpha proteobacterium Q-1]GER04294.1 GntR family transcriptional regulator [Iodidimonas nitroreducens]